MSKRSRAKPTPDELISLLSRSSLPTVVVEGGDDMIVFRKLEAKLDQYEVDVLPAEGRKTLLEVFERRDEIKNDKKLVFIADKDCWVYSTIPEHMDDPTLILTDGYSIENDVIRDGNFVGYLDGTEKSNFDAELSTVLDCYAIGLARIHRNEDGKIAFHPNEVLDNPLRRIMLFTLRDGESCPSKLRGEIAEDFQKLLRGKTLMGLLIRQMNRAGRAARHNSQALMEIVANNPGPLISRLYEDAEAAFQ